MNGISIGFCKFSDRLFAVVVTKGFEDLEAEF